MVNLIFICVFYSIDTPWRWKETFVPQNWIFHLTHRMGREVNAEIWSYCYFFFFSKKRKVDRVILKASSLSAAGMCYFSFLIPVWHQDLVITLVTLCQMFSGLIADRPEAGLMETEDRHTFFFWKSRDDGHENIDINLFFPLLKKPKYKTVQKRA